MLWLLRLDAEQAICMPLFCRLERDTFDEFSAAPGAVFVLFNPGGNLYFFVYHVGNISCDPFWFINMAECVGDTLLLPF